MFKQYRKRLGLTQEKIAELANIDIRNYQKIESDDVIPLANTFAKIAFSLNMSEEEIIKELKYCSKINHKKGKNKIE